MRARWWSGFPPGSVEDRLCQRLMGELDRAPRKPAEGLWWTMSWDWLAVVMTLPSRDGIEYYRINGGGGHYVLGIPVIVHPGLCAPAIITSPLQRPPLLRVREMTAAELAS